MSVRGRVSASHVGHFLFRLPYSSTYERSDALISDDLSARGHRMFVLHAEPVSGAQGCRCMMFVSRIGHR